ncbi:MAG: gp76 [uncultured marine phage]|uniref:Gp76 n=1 Tax=uncultured marine phage TaxID=707152 RepID=A0A8D9CC34_9VIRU|nr:MAG: gp76 [uncultured marine phage]
MLDQNFFKVKYRPKSQEDLILLPRIKKIIDQGLSDHMLLFGTYGVGKTALVNLLCKGRPYLELNSSLDTSIDILRTKVDEFCSKMSMFDSKDDIKVVFLDEIDRVSAQYQDALKAFMEKNERNVRFIATTNHINRINDGVLDRFGLKIDFTPRDADEVNYLKVNYAKRLVKISKEEEITIKPDDIKQIVNRNFPSFRKMLSVLQYCKITGEVDFTTKSFDEKLKIELYELIMSTSNTEKTYHFLMDKFGPDSMDELIQLLGRPFIEYVGANKREMLPKLGNIIVLVTKYGDMLDSARAADPIIIGSSLIHEIQTL